MRRLTVLPSVVAIRPPSDGTRREPTPGSRKIKQLAAFLALCAFTHASHGAALVVGGFSTGRVGPASMTQGPVTEELRATITSDYPGSTFVASDTLTPAFLNTVDYLVVGAPTLSAPTFLSPAEQTALLNYVTSGGAALIFIDNDTYAGVPTSDDTNETFLDPFGIDSTGRVPSASNATSSAPAHPVMNGPAGVVTTFATNFGGWFENLGANGTALALYDQNGQTALAAIAPGALAPGSGGVVFIGDADSLVDSADGGLFAAADNTTFFRNAVAFAVPEPSAALFVVTGTLLMRMRRKAAAGRRA